MFDDTPRCCKFFSQDEETPGCGKSSIDKNFTVARLVKGGASRSLIVRQDWQWLVSRRSSIKPLSRTVACTRDELCLPLHESREDRGNPVGSSPSSADAFDCALATTQREHGKHLLLSRTSGVHFLYNVGIIVYGTDYNIDRLLASILSHFESAASSSSAPRIPNLFLSLSPFRV